MRSIVLVAVGLLLAACGDERTHACRMAACVAPTLPVSFVADAETLSSLSGEFRDKQSPETVLRFDCGGAENDGLELHCVDGEVDLAWMQVSPGSVIEVRFDTASGSPTAWQKLTLNVSQVTVEAFNGPGCPCSYYQAQPDPVTVPAGTAQGDSGSSSSPDAVP